MIINSFFHRKFGAPSAQTAEEARLEKANQQFTACQRLNKAFAIYPGDSRDLDQLYCIENGSTVRVLIDKKSGALIKSEPLPDLGESVPAWQQLGMVELIPAQGKSNLVIAQEIRDASRRSPIIILDDVVVELTGVCNLACPRCSRGGSHPQETGLSVPLIKNALLPLLLLGIPQISFSGGEATLRLPALFDLLRFAKDHVVDPARGRIVVMSNGTIKEPKKFLQELQNIGGILLRVTLASYSPERNDQESGCRGVFAQIKTLITIAAEMTFPVSIMAHDIGGHESRQARENKDFFERHCETVFAGPVDAMSRIGGAALSDLIPRDTPFPENDFGALQPNKQRHQPGWCKCLAQPHKLFIRPGGNVGSCSLGAHIPEEFGNLEKHTMVELLNNIHDSPLVRLFRSGTIEKMQHLVDRKIFQGPYSQACVPMIITVIFSEIYERLIAANVPQEKAVVMANERTASLTGYNKTSALNI